MKVRALVIDAFVKAEVARVMAHAVAHPTPWEELRRRASGEGDLPPLGDDPAFCCHMDDGYRCVYTEEYQRLGGVPVRCRHLSVSVNGGLLPNPRAVSAIMQEFGFYGDLGAAIVWTEKIPGGGAAVNVLQRRPEPVVVTLTVGPEGAKFTRDLPPASPPG
jgi:hypothetical protein